jgi:hypothetical protein
MWPMGFTYHLLGWPTFHPWGLVHGAVFSAWPTLSLLAFLALGYVKQFTRFEDTSFLLAATLWGLLLTGFLGATENLDGQRQFYGLLVATAVIIGFLCFLAKQKILVPLFVILPTIFLQLQFIVFASPRHAIELLRQEAFNAIGVPLLFSFVGYVLGSIVRGFVRA